MKIIKMANPEINNGKINATKRPMNLVWGDRFPKHTIEQMEEDKNVMVNDKQNSFISSVYNAFCYHKRLVITPDMIWIAILQQLTIHVSKNSEQLRSKFVSFDGEQIIKVQRDEFRLGLKNDWVGVFSEFSSKIKEYIGDENHSNLILDFSTTTATTKAAMEVALMDVVKSYFKYEVHTMCGIPEFEIHGTKEDWTKMLNAVKYLKKFDLNWWVEDLSRFVSNFVDIFDFNDDQDYKLVGFWNDFFTLRSGSGRNDADGEVNVLFPYIKNKKDNGDDPYKRRASNSIDLADYPSGVSSVPFTWFYFEQELKMKFVAGFAGFTQGDSNTSLTANISWAILEEPKT